MTILIQGGSWMYAGVLIAFMVYVVGGIAKAYVRRGAKDLGNLSPGPMKDLKEAVVQYCLARFSQYFACVQIGILVLRVDQ